MTQFGTRAWVFFRPFGRFCLLLKTRQRWFACPKPALRLSRIEELGYDDSRWAYDPLPGLGGWPG